MLRRVDGLLGNTTGPPDLSGLRLCGTCRAGTDLRISRAVLSVSVVDKTFASPADSVDIFFILKHSFPVPSPTQRNRMTSQKTIRIVTRGKNGELRTRDYAHEETVLKMHTQIGIDDCSTDLSLRGLPVFRGLIGPMPESKEVVRYEAPEVFESLTKEWGATPTKRKPRRRAAQR